MALTAYPRASAALAALALAGCAQPAPMPQAMQESAGRMQAQMPAGPCNPQVSAALAARGVASDMVARFRYQIDASDSVVFNIVAWAFPASGRGYWVVDMSPSCRVKQVYGMDGAHMPEPAR